jgi:integrase
MASIERRSGARGDVYLVRYRDSEKVQRAQTFDNFAEARRYANQAQHRLDIGDWIDVSKGREKFGAFHARWIEARSVSPSRLATEISQANNHILPTWKNVALCNISPMEVDRWIKLLDVGATTKHMVFVQFKQCLKQAVRDGHLRSNPAEGTRVPKRRRKNVTLEDVLDSHEVELLTKAMPDEWKALVFLSAYLGWRWSEAMGLRWRDVDLKNNLVHVGRQTLVESQGTLHEGRGKTEAANRVVPLPDVAVRMFRWHRETFAVDAPEDRLVFLSPPCPAPGRHAVGGRKGGCNVAGVCIGHTPLRSNFRRVFVKAIEVAGLEGRGLYMRQLRHTAIEMGRFYLVRGRRSADD